jgi:2-polyprenyl-6-methoxyphenol hydroxylase-like FAD-dependent oxidoreductase
MGKIGTHAVDVGASMGGLLAARVLADAYEKVTITDRDSLPPTVLQAVALRDAPLRGCHPQILRAPALSPRTAMWGDGVVHSATGLSAAPYSRSNPGR